MDIAKAVWESRRRAGLTQRQLAERSGVAQPVIARIERAKVVPRADTLARLIEACGFALEVTPPMGAGVDRTLIDEELKLTPGERLRRAGRDAEGLDWWDRAVARSRAQ